jgi:DNA (cytosine-5)-methyltransferase 1
MKFMDFCAGIGGGRLGLQTQNFNCVSYAEIDEAPALTYQTFFGTDEKNFGDITKITPSSLPDFDIMIGGFPCQTFSIMGQRKGFEDIRGQVIYSLIEILREKNIPYFILENVKGLVNHNGGSTLKTILSEFDNAGYEVWYKVLDSQNYGVPQMRERVYFVGVRKDLMTDVWFRFPEYINMPSLQDYLIDIDNSILSVGDKIFQKYLNNKYNHGSFDLEKILFEDYLVLDTRQSDLRLYRNKVPTLRTGRHGILYVKNGKLKRLSGYEALLLQGFPKDFAEKAKGKITDSKLLSQAGNAMTVPTISAIAERLTKYIQGEW